MLKDSTTFIPLDVEMGMALVQQITFIVSCCLHIPALYCLFKETPPHQAQIKPILVLLQFTVILVDIYESILYQPVALPEAAASYCKGVICGMVHPITALGIFMFGVVAIGITNIACIIVRHQAILPEKHRLKVKKRSTYVIFLVILTLTFAIPIPAFMTFSISNEEMDRLITESYFEISWIRERGAYFKFPDTVALHVIVSIAVVFLLGYMVVSALPFWHMFHVLRNTKSCTHSKITIRQSLLRLFAQLIVPFLFIATPLTIISMQYLFRCFPFMVGVCVILIIPLHPIVHNIVLLLIMPTYRRVIARMIGRLRKKSNISTHKVSTGTQRRLSAP